MKTMEVIYGGDRKFAFTALNNLTFQKQLFEKVGSSGQPKFNKTEYLRM